MGKIKETIIEYQDTGHDRYGGWSAKAAAKATASKKKSVPSTNNNTITTTLGHLMDVASGKVVDKNIDVKYAKYAVEYYTKLLKK